MHRFALGFLMVAAMTAVMVAQSNHAAKPTAPALELAVKTDRKTYRISDTVRMETRLLNNGNTDVYIWEWDLCWNIARGLSMYVSTPDGKPVQPRVWFDCVPPPPAEGKAYAFIKLEPRRFYGIADGFKITDVINKPGAYDIRVTYNSFLSSSFIDEYLSRDPISTLPVWTMEQPTLTAPAIRIVVTR